MHVSHKGQGAATNREKVQGVTLTRAGAAPCKNGLVRTLYTDIKGCILNNGWVSAPFRVFSRDKTGVFGFSFNLRSKAEIMAIKLRETKHIRGIEI